MVTYEEFRTLLLKAIDQTIEAAQTEVADSLPHESILVLYAFERDLQPSSVGEVASLLYVNGTIPKLINIGYQGIIGNYSVIWIAPTGFRPVHDLSETANVLPGLGPFKVIGLVMPKHIWDRPRPLSRQDMEEASPKHIRTVYKQSL